MIQAVVFAMAAAAQAVPSGAPSPIARDYFMDARRTYRTAAYAEGTNSVIRRYAREDPFGVDAKYDQPDLTRRQIPDEPTVWGLKGLRNVRDIGGWTGLRPGMVYRGSQLYRVADAPDGIDPETRRVVTEVWKLRTDFDLRGNAEWGIRNYGKTNLVEFQEMGVPKVAHRFPSYEKLFENPAIVGAALKDLAKPETYPTYIHCAGGADRTGSLIYILEALCGAAEADMDIDYELTSFAAIFGLRDRNVTLSVSFKRFKDRFNAYPGATVSERVANACKTTFGLTADEIASIRRILTPETDWVYSLVDQVTGIRDQGLGIGDQGLLRLRKGWNGVRRDVVPVAIGGPDKGQPFKKVVRQPTPPPFPNEQDRAYEFARINRQWDEHAPLVEMDTADGWTVETENAEARFYTTSARKLYRDSVARLEYRADFAKDTNAVVRLRLAKPIEIDRGFNASSLWFYGNVYAYDLAEGARSFDIFADYRGRDGRVFSIKTAENWCAYWFLGRHQFEPHEAPLTADGATFLGFTIRGFANEASFLSLDFARFAVFNDETERPDIPARPKRAVTLFPDQDVGMSTGEGTLAFPTTPDTVVPPVAKENPDLEFRFPAKPDESWDDLAFRYRGGEWIAVAKGGGILPRGAGKGGMFRFRRVGDSIVCDLQVKGGKVTDVVCGDLDYAKLPNCRKIPVPYYHGTVAKRMFAEIKQLFDIRTRPGLVVTELGGEPFFIGATWDWTQSGGSWPYCESERAPFGGVAYFPRTDGSLADCCERIVWSFAREPADALANIPNPQSPYRKLSGQRVFAFARSYDLPLVPTVNPQENETRERIWDYWRRVRRLGVKDLNVNGHEKMWRDYMDSFTFKTNGAPLKGGDAPIREMVGRLQSLGFRVGPYNNFTDFAPVNENWDPNKVVRHTTAFVPWTNQMAYAWTRTYLPKPVYAVHAMETLLPVVKAKFGFQNAYSDVHTAYAPWYRIDYDRRMPGAGSMTGSFYSYGELLHKQKFIWDGPVYSEGWGHVVYAGLSDGDFARDDDYFSGGHSDPKATSWDWPWIVDYDLKRIHPLNNCIGTMARNFYGRHKPADPDEYADRHTCYVLAFGHALVFHNGFFMRDNSLAIDERLELRNYYMPLAAAKRYTQAEATEIRYGDAEDRLLDSAHAIASGAVALNHVKVTYSDGTVVAVNGSRTKPFSLDWSGRRLTLDPNCYVARSGDGVKVFSAFVDGHRADLAVTPEYVYLDGRGTFVSFDEGASDGLMLRLRYTSVVEKPLKAGEEDVILRHATVAELPYVAKRIVAMDQEGVAFRTVEPEIRDGRTVLRPIDGAASYRVTAN